MILIIDILYLSSGFPVILHCGQKILSFFAMCQHVWFLYGLLLGTVIQVCYPPRLKVEVWFLGIFPVSSYVSTVDNYSGVLYNAGYISGLLLINIFFSTYLNYNYTGQRFLLSCSLKVLLP